MLGIFLYSCKWTEIVCCITQKLGRKINTNLGSLLQKFRLFVQVLFYNCLSVFKLSWKPQESSVEEIMILHGTNFDQFRKSGASTVGDSCYPTYSTVCPSNSGLAKPPPCTFGGTTGQEQVLLCLISIPKEFRQHLRYYSSIEHTFLYLNCKPGCTLLLGKQVDCSYLCASLFGQGTQYINSACCLWPWLLLIASRNTWKLLQLSQERQWQLAVPEKRESLN